MRYHLFQKFFGKMVRIKETSFLSTREDTYFLPPLYQWVWPEKKIKTQTKCPKSWISIGEGHLMYLKRVHLCFHYA